MASPLERLKAAFRGAKTSAVADLEAAVTDAAAVLQKSEADLAKVESERRETLTATDKERAAWRARLRDAQDAAEDARELHAALAESLAAARAAEVQAAKRRRRQDALAARDAAAAALRKRYPALSKEFRALLRLTLEADALVAQANADLPEGALPIAETEVVVRDKPHVPAKVLRRREEEEICSARNPETVLVAREIERDEETGEEHVMVAGRPERIRRRKVIVTETQDGAPAVPGPRLAAVYLPGLTGEDPPAWNGKAGFSPADTLEALAKLEAAKPISPGEGFTRESRTYADELPANGQEAA